MLFSKKFNKSTSLILLVLFFVSYLFPIYPRTLNAAQEYGYVEIHCENNMGQSIKDIQQWPVALTNGTGSYYFTAPAIANYRVYGYFLNGEFYSGDGVQVTVTSLNTPSNPVRLVFKYVSTFTTKTVTIYGCLGSRYDNYTHKIINFENVSSTPQNVTFKVTDIDLPDLNVWEFDHSESPVSMNGGPTVTLPISINSPDNQEIRFIYKKKSGAVITGPVSFTVTNNELNDDETGVVTQSNGLDNFGRYESGAVYGQLYDNGSGVYVIDEVAAWHTAHLGSI